MAFRDTGIVVFGVGFSVAVDVFVFALTLIQTFLEFIPRGRSDIIVTIQRVLDEGITPSNPDITPNAVAVLDPAILTTPLADPTEERAEACAVGQDETEDHEAEEVNGKGTMEVDEGSTQAEDHH